MLDFAKLKSLCYKCRPYFFGTLLPLGIVLACIGIARGFYFLGASMLVFYSLVAYYNVESDILGAQVDNQVNYD